MSRSNKPEPPKEVVAAYFPYGRAGHSVGRFANSTAMGLATDVRVARGHQRYWTQMDYRSLNSALLMERSTRHLRMSLDVPFDRRQSVADRLNKLLATTREAMPYLESERRWLVDEEIRLGSGSDRELVTNLNMVEGQVISAGVRQTIQGRELTDRWWMWRRQIGEFEDQGSREDAYDALRGLGQLLVPEDRAEMERAGIPWSYVPQRL
jgi:hypothetical protein